MYKISLIDMPFASARLPSIALTQLKSVLQSELGDRVTVDICYINHDFVRYLGSFYGQIVDSMEHLHTGLGDWLFRTSAFPGIANNADDYFRRCYPRRSAEVQQLKEKVLDVQEGLDDFLSIMIDKYQLGQANLVGNAPHLGLVQLTHRKERFGQLGLVQPVQEVALVLQRVEPLQKLHLFTDLAHPRVMPRGDLLGAARHGVVQLFGQQVQLRQRDGRCHGMLGEQGLQAGVVDQGEFRLGQVDAVVACEASQHGGTPACGQGAGRGPAHHAGAQLLRIEPQGPQGEGAGGPEEHIGRPEQGEYEREGVPVWAVSVQNEPLADQRWDSCLYSAEEERDFVRDHLGPALRDAGLGDVKIVIWDHNRDLMVERAAVVFSDPKASSFVWGTGFHWYGPECFDHVQQVHDAWPDKHLLFTEGCQEGGPHLGSWEVGERYARNVIHDLNRWTVGWIDWNLLLDEQGGPNHVGNFCSAPILADTRHGVLMHQSAYWVLGHFARFIRPGAGRVLAVAAQGIDATAYANPDGSTVVVATNPHDDGLRFALDIDGRCGAVDLPPRSIATLVSSQR